SCSVVHARSPWPQRRAAAPGRVFHSAGGPAPTVTSSAPEWSDDGDTSASFVRSAGRARLADHPAHELELAGPERARSGVPSFAGTGPARRATFRTGG